MKHTIICTFFVLMMLFMSACIPGMMPDESIEFTKHEETRPSETTETKPEITEPAEPENTELVPGSPEHASWYIPDVPVEDVICYFNEVCLDSEIVNSGDPSVIQKWTTPVYYTLEGDYTDTDINVVNTFVNWLNNLEGFPGISQTKDYSIANLRIYFYDRDGMIALMGRDFADMDGAVTYWYDNDEIYDATICCRTDLDQMLRNSVILEEMYNGMGPIQDTLLRPDSLIYQEFSQPQWLSPMDELILQLLYHPDIHPGMNADECEQVIRELYY